jgi:tetratricopeptide (TPR) repeat protein
MLPFYPHPEDSLPLWKPAIVVVALLVISVTCWRIRKNHPATLMGWLWFLIVLLPVIGFIQVGGQAMADRYTYVSYIGLSILLSACAAPILTNASTKRRILASATVLWLLALTTLAIQQTALWNNSVTLFTHTLKHSPQNLTALTNLGEAYLTRDQHKEAIETMKTALSFHSGSIDNMRNLGQAYREIKKLKESEDILRNALSLHENNPDTLNILAMTLSDSGQAKEAIALLRRAVRIDSTHADAFNNLGNASLTADNTRVAGLHFFRALQIDPRKAETWSNLGALYLQTNDFDTALDFFEKSLQFDPDNPVTLVNYATTLFQLGNKEDAFTHTRRALEIDAQFDQGIEFLRFLESQP